MGKTSIMNDSYMDSIIGLKFLRENPDHIFVFGDNLIGKGKKGGAIHRDEPNAYGFVTKKRPSYDGSAYYRPAEYKHVFKKEMEKLEKDIKACPHFTFMISKIGSGLADKYGIYRKVIREGLRVLQKYDNVTFLFDIDE
jgi:hypothetical protein